MRPAVRHLPARVPGIFVAGTVLAIALLVSIVGSVLTYRQVSSAFRLHLASEAVREQVNTLFAIQLDEETGLRGYLASGQRLFLQPYTTASPRWGGAYRQLQDSVQAAGQSTALPAVVDLSRSHGRWESEVAEPLIARPTLPQMSQRLTTGKVLVDRIRGDFAKLTQYFDSQANAQTAQAESLLVHASIFTALLMLIFGAAAIIADYVRSRTIVALEREQTIADTLQRVFLSGWERIEGLRIGTSYLSATREAALGGDLFDVYRIDDNRTMLLVADISGKGLYAAVETALVKFSVRMLVQDDPDPGSVLQKFNATFLKTADDPSAFVSVFLGILDHRTKVLRYANAGHGPVYVRHDGSVSQLQVTGPLIGIRSDAAFASASLSIGPDDMVVLATDGLTEARDSSGMMLEDDRAMRWIFDGRDDPQGLADDIVARLGKYAGGRIADDLALLVVRWAEPAEPKLVSVAQAGGMAAQPGTPGGPGGPAANGPSQPSQEVTAL